jgi:hypothetical protein
MKRLILSIATIATCYTPILTAIELSENSYVSLNPKLRSASVISLSDNNAITVGDQTLELNLYEHATFSSPNAPIITPGTVITGTGPFDIGSAMNGTDMLVHASMRGTAFVMPHSRNNHTYHMISPKGDALVEINVGGEVYQRTLPEGEVINFQAGEVNGNISTIITSDVPILVSHSATSSSGYVTDASPMPPAAMELWGLCSNYANLSAVQDDTHVTIHTSDSRSTQEIILNRGDKHPICTNLTPEESKQGQGPAVHITADKPVGAVQIADNDGLEQTAFYPTALLNSRFAIPMESQYIAVTCPSADTNVTLYQPNGEPETKDCDANGDQPGKAYFGNGDANGTHIVQGSYLESSKPIHVIYESSRTEDEHNLLGTSDHNHSSSNGFFQWGAEDAPVGPFNRRTPGQPFDDVNKYAKIITDIVDTVPGDACHSGNRCIRLGYPVNEAGVELQVNNLATRAGETSKSLYTRKYEYYGDEWQGNWPVGLKTSRYFTDARRHAAYMSEKLIWQTYNGDQNDQYGRGLNNAIGNLDLKATYKEDQLFGNGLPYLRTGHWYKFETWMVLDSAVDANDGVLRVWIDDVLVYNNQSVPWRSTKRGVTEGGNYWSNMWFGGNYSGATFGAPSETLYRYIDDLYLSTTLDR